MVTFHAERLADSWDEASQYAAAHAADVGLGVNLEHTRSTLTALDDIGMLKCHVMRDDGTLVGYCVWLLSPALLERRLTAQALMLYVRPESRGVGSVRFLGWCVEELKRDGVLACYAAVGKIDYSRLLTRMGFEKSQTLYRKDL